MKIITISREFGSGGREVGKRLHLRKTPELKFIADDSIERGMEIAKKLGDILPDEKDEL